MGQIIDSIPKGAKWQGADELVGQLIELKQLVALPGNPRQGDIGALSQSLERFGQQKGIVVDEKGVILAGNHTYLAAQAIGWTHIAATLSGLEGSEKSAYALADNHVSDLANYNEDALLAMLEQAYADGGLIGTGYDEEDLNDLARRVDSLNMSMDEVDWEGMPEFNQPNIQSAYRVSIHFETLEDAEAFFALIERPRKRIMWWPESDHKGSDRSLAWVADEP